MHRLRIITVFILLPMVAESDGLPDTIELTSDLAATLGFEVSSRLDGKIVLGAITFPAKIDGVWLPTSTLVALIDGETEILNTRTDFTEPSNNPIIVSFPVDSEPYDVAVFVSYSCIAETRSACGTGSSVRYYGINSIRSLLPMSK